jgi:hypothetical protein
VNPVSSKTEEVTQLSGVGVENLLEVEEHVNP